MSELTKEEEEALKFEKRLAEAEEADRAELQSLQELEN